jgi:hypothetical protein
LGLDPAPIPADTLQNMAKLGTPGYVIRRRDLKPKKPQTDAQLLASAMRSAVTWQQKKEKTR